LARRRSSPAPRLPGTPRARALGRHASRRGAAAKTLTSP